MQIFFDEFGPRSEYKLLEVNGAERSHSMLPTEADKEAFLSNVEYISSESDGEKHSTGKKSTISNSSDPFDSAKKELDFDNISEKEDELFSILINLLVDMKDLFPQKEERMKMI